MFDPYIISVAVHREGNMNTCRECNISIDNKISQHFCSDCLKEVLHRNCGSNQRMVRQIRNGLFIRLYLCFCISIIGLSYYGAVTVGSLITL